MYVCVYGMEPSFNSMPSLTRHQGNSDFHVSCLSLLLFLDFCVFGGAFLCMSAVVWLSSDMEVTCTLSP